MNVDDPKREFPWPISLAHLSEDARSFSIEANEASRRAIAARLGLASLDRLGAALTVRRDGDPGSPCTGVIVEGRVTGHGTQTCVVSLQPVAFSIDVAVDGLVLPPDSSEVTREELTLEDDEIDILGEIEDGSIDLGELTVQQLALELDPFPRADGVEPDWRGDDAEAPDSAENGPFAALAKLKETLK